MRAVVAFVAVVLVAVGSAASIVLDDSSMYRQLVQTAVFIAAAVCVGILIAVQARIRRQQAAAAMAQAHPPQPAMMVAYVQQQPVPTQFGQFQVPTAAVAVPVSSASSGLAAAQQWPAWTAALAMAHSEQAALAALSGIRQLLSLGAASYLLAGSNPQAELLSAAHAARAANATTWTDAVARDFAAVLQQLNFVGGFPAYGQGGSMPLRESGATERPAAAAAAWQRQPGEEVGLRQDPGSTSKARGGSALV